MIRMDGEMMTIEFICDVTTNCVVPAGPYCLDCADCLEELDIWHCLLEMLSSGLAKMYLATYTAANATQWTTI
jgi:hypothetical protein